MKRTTVKQLKKGDFFCMHEIDDSIKEVPSSKVWVRGEYDHSAKKFEICKFDDVNHTRFVMGSKQVYNNIYF